MDGSLYAWGKNTASSLGLGNAGYYVNQPKKVRGDLEGKEIVGLFCDRGGINSNEEMYAVDSDGAMYIWGGYSPTLDTGAGYGSITEPTRVTALEGKHMVFVSPSVDQ